MSDEPRKVTVSFPNDKQEILDRLSEYQGQIGEKNKSKVLVSLIEQGLAANSPEAESTSYEFDQVSLQLDELRKELAAVLGALSGMSRDLASVSKATATNQEEQKRLEVGLGELSEVVGEAFSGLSGERAELLEAVAGTQKEQRGLRDEFGQLSEVVGEAFSGLSGERAELLEAVAGTEKEQRGLRAEFGQLSEVVGGAFSGLSGERAKVLDAVAGTEKEQRGLRAEFGQLSEAVAQVIGDEMGKICAESKRTGEMLVAEARQEFEGEREGIAAAMSGQRAEGLARAEKSLDQGGAELDQKLGQLVESSFESLLEKFRAEVSVVASSIVEETRTSLGRASRLSDGNSERVETDRPVQGHSAFRERRRTTMEIVARPPEDDEELDCSERASVDEHDATEGGNGDRDDSDEQNEEECHLDKQERDGQEESEEEEYFYEEPGGLSGQGDDPADLKEETPWDLGPADKPWEASFWTSRGQSKKDADLIVICFPEYWADRRVGSDMTSNKHCAGICLQDNVSKRSDPRYWLHQGCDTMEATRRALKAEQHAWETFQDDARLGGKERPKKDCIVGPILPRAK